MACVPGSRASWLLDGLSACGPDWGWPDQQVVQFSVVAQRNSTACPLFGTYPTILVVSRPAPIVRESRAEHRFRELKVLETIRFIETETAECV